MRKILLMSLLSVAGSFIYSQDLSKFKLYRPEENAAKEIKEAVKQAKAEDKHVFIQAGGNWCIWCARFNEFITTDKTIDSMIVKNFVVYHLNYSKENKNSKIFKKYGYAQRFGFPVFMILDGKGKLLHIQNSAYLEEGKGYSKSKVMEFLSNWSPAAIDPANYKTE